MKKILLLSCLAAVLVTTFGISHNTVQAQDAIIPDSIEKTIVS